MSDMIDLYASALLSDESPEDEEVGTNPDGETTDKPSPDGDDDELGGFGDDEELDEDDDTEDDEM
jgi:hypothetical protein